MYILNTSFIVDHDVHGLWLEMVKTKLMPFIKEKGYGDFVFTKVISNDNSEGFTYSLQVNISDLGQYEAFMNEVIGEYSSIALPAFGEKALYFCSLLKHVEL